MSARQWLQFSIMLLVAASAVAAVLTPSIRQNIQDYLAGSGRDVLATAEGDVLNDSTTAKVIKFKSRDGIWVEIVKLEAEGKSTLIDRILLPDKHDGLFNYQGHVTRLAIADIDQDGSLELLAPTFDQQLVPHLNVFRYNPALKKFEPYQPTSH